MDKIFTKAGPGVVVLLAQLLKRLRQKDHKFKASLGNLIRLYLKIKVWDVAHGRTLARNGQVVDPISRITKIRKTVEDGKLSHAHELAELTLKMTILQKAIYPSKLEHNILQSLIEQILISYEKQNKQTTNKNPRYSKQS